MKKTNRIGILGGSFDPVHNGHIILAIQAKKEFHLDKIIFVPAKRPPHKLNQKLTSAQHRLNMLQLAIRPYGYCAVTRFEIQKKSTTYTYQLLKHFLKKHSKSEVFFIMGSDSLNDLKTWKKPEQVASLCEFIVGRRPGYKNTGKNNTKKEIRFIRRQLPAVSSSSIRELAAQNKNISGLVPDAVKKYITRNHLYHEPTNN